MLTSLLLLLPVGLILIWAYWYLLPKNGGPAFAVIDVVLMVLLLVFSLLLMQGLLSADWSDYSGILPHIFAVAGGYTLFAFGLLAALLLRRKFGQRSQSE